MDIELYICGEDFYWLCLCLWNARVAEGEAFLKIAPVGPPGPLWAGPLWAALVGRALMDWTLIGWALIGRAPPWPIRAGPSCAGPL